ncbi:MAG TPA: YCF48-related protein [Pyrinomonadaceae bacterium]|nr:YCF48-related protein [Pyrinomonadaceae bacterium]
MRSKFFEQQKLIVALFLWLISSLLPLAVSGQAGWSFAQKENSAAGGGDLVSVFFTSSEEGWVGGDNGYLARTTDGGRSWVKRSLSTTENINEIYFRNDENGYVLAGRKIYITTDKGSNWRETRIFQLNELKGLTPEFLSVRFVDKRRGYIVGSALNRKEEVVDSLVLQTVDGGESWHRINVPTKVELFHLDFVGDERGWIVGDKGTILFTEDGGGTWQKQASGTDRALYSVDFRNDEEGYIVGGRGVILRTGNGGRTWEKVASPAAGGLRRVIFTDDKNGFITGLNGVILRTADKGRTWTKQESRTPEALYGLYMEKKYGWAVGGKGVILRYQR